MSIEALQKVTIAGHLQSKNEVLEGLQELGCLHLIPLTPEGKASDDAGASRNAREALHFLASASPRRRQVTNPKQFDAALLETQALELQRRHFELLNRRDFISTRVDNLAVWGDFEFPTTEELGGNRLWFYPVPHHQMADVAKTGQRWQVTHRDQRYCYVVAVSPDEPEDMPVARLPTGGVSRHALIEELEEVESALEDLEAERLGLTRWCTLFARALDGLEDSAARARASAQTAAADPVYALQAWVPGKRINELQAYAREQTLVLEVSRPDSAEQPPTLFNNPAPVRAGEDLVKFYMTPSYWLWDPSSLVFVSFALFFAMIVADAGYALLLGGIVLAYRKRLATSETGRRWRVMLSALAGATALYGVLAGSYFGLSPPPGSPLAHLHVLDLGDFTVMMALSIIIGSTHIACANVMDALRHPHWPQRLPPLGWACAVLGGLGAWGGMQLASDALVYGGAGLMAIGLLAVAGFSGYGEKPLKRILSGVTALAGVSGAFGDVLSYLRLFALGLASASLAMAFNDMASDVRQAMPGLGFLFALLILVLGHSLNFLLSVSSGFIHGLRLNVIEFFKWGVKDEGNPYRPFEKGEYLVDDFILALGWVGVYAPLALGAVGSMVGVSRGGMAACGALLEVESGYGRFIGVSAMPSSQTIYGIVVMLTLNVGVSTDNAPGIFAIGLLAGIALMVSGFAQGAACAAAINASKSKPEVFGISIAPAAVVEGFAVFAFVFALVLAGSVPGMGG